MSYHYNLGTFFKEVVHKYSDNPAIRYSNRIHTYKDLDEKSDQIASFLLHSGLSQGDVIAIASTKVFEDYALMVACLKCGIVYTNIDIDNPTERIEHIFETCVPKIVFCSKDISEINNLSKKINIKYLVYSDIPSNKKIPKFSNIDGQSVSYIMFTSGSTGIPKGAAITHQSIIHFIAWATERFKVVEKDNFANISPMYFDNSVFDFFTALFSGASLTPINKDLLSKPLDLIKYIDELKCTIWFSVPSMLIYMLIMKVLTKNNLQNIRTFVFGGEGFPKTELKKLYDLYKGKAEFINVYGPTECTCICSSYTITEKDFDDLNELPCLGPINQNFSYVILDQEKTSKKGELCLIGPNVGNGYYNDPKKTEQTFVTYTDKNHYKKAMYKTGDLVKEENGFLYFLGRIDNQIKHMGYRIELEEIEMSLNSLPYIKQAAVIYNKVSDVYGKIVAFIIAERTVLDILEVKAGLKKKLPNYMMPGEYKVLNNFPKNSNGKIDKKKLKSQLIKPN